MKYKLLLLLLALSCLPVPVYKLMAQAPQQMNYQAEVRDKSGQPVAQGTSVSLRFTIHDISTAGTVVFQEAQNTTARVPGNL